MHQLWCIQVMASLAADQLNSAGDVLWDDLFVSGFVLQLLGLLLAAHQAISLGNPAMTLSLSREFSLTFFNLCFILF